VGPKYIYKETGCYYTCKYTEFYPELMSQDEIDEDEEEVLYDTNKIIRLDLYISAAAIRTDSEKLVYDFYDLVGNIGGFLGLLLGWSLLSVYDSAKEKTVRSFKVCRDWWKARTEWQN
jgi:hypothetical protein